jgi:hypothetical protein
MRVGGVTSADADANAGTIGADAGRCLSAVVLVSTVRALLNMLSLVLRCVSI